jgi:transposase
LARGRAACPGGLERAGPDRRSELGRAGCPGDRCPDRLPSEHGAPLAAPVQRGIDGLGDRPGAGRKRRITEAQRSHIIALARSLPPGQLARDAAGELSTDDEHGPAQWTLDTLAETARDAGIAVGRSQVRRVLLAEKVRWRRTRSWVTSTDPEFVPKGPGSWSSIPPRRAAPP